MLKTLFGVLIVVWMTDFGLRIAPLLLVIALVVVLIHLAIHRRAVH